MAGFCLVAEFYSLILGQHGILCVHGCLVCAVQPCLRPCVHRLYRRLCDRVYQLYFGGIADCTERM